MAVSVKRLRSGPSVEVGLPPSWVTKHLTVAGRGSWCPIHVEVRIELRIETL